MKPFYGDTTGAWVLGHNQAQGAGSHLQAGARADLISSPITKALSTFGGRIAAQTMQYMFKGSVKRLLNYAALRPYTEMDAIKFALGDHKADKVVLDPAAGFTPIYYWLAQELRHTSFIEIDTEKMMSSKEAALKGFDMPKNLQFQSADLAEKHLHQVFDEKVDVIVLLAAYVNHSDCKDLLKYVTNLIKDDGAVVLGFPYKPGIDNFTENTTIFSRIVTTPTGTISNENDVALICKDTDFTPVRYFYPSAIAERYDKPAPMDAEVFVVAKKGVAMPRVDEELDEAVELNDALHDADDGVPPFIEFDPESFKRFPRRTRIIPPKKL